MFEIIVYQFLDSFNFGGGENVALNYALIFNDLGIENYIVAKNVINNNYINKLKSLNINYLLYKEFLNKRINTQDKFIIHTNRNLIKLVIMKIFNKKINKDNIFYIQHLNYTEKKFKKLSKIINKHIGNFIQITPITEKLIDKYIKSKVHFFPNFYINKYKKEDYKKIKATVRKELNLLEKDYVVCFSGIFKKGKNVEDFLKLSKIFSNKKNMKFILLGDGPEDYLIKKYKNKNLIWLGRVSDVEKYLIASDVYLFSSLYKGEMMPMALIEAINCNTVSLAYNTEINKFLIDNDLICNNFEDMQNKLEKLYTKNIKNYTYKKYYNYNYALKNLKSIIGVE